MSYLYGDHLGSISGETEALLAGHRYLVPLSGRSEDPDDYPPPEPLPQPMQRYYPKHRLRCQGPPAAAMP